MPAQIPEVGGIPMTISAIPREASVTSLRQQKYTSPDECVRATGSVARREGMTLPDQYHPFRHHHFLKKASSAACAMASSISDLAPLAAMPPIVWPSTLMGSPPWLGK